MFKMPNFSNPQQFIRDALANNPNVANNRPDGQQLINILNSNDPSIMEQKARELLQERGLTAEQALGPFANFFK